MTRRFATAALATALFTAAAVPAAAATTYASDPNHSEVGFRVRHFVTKVRGEFEVFTATIVRDDANPANSSVELVIQAASIDTGVQKRDDDLRSANFFEVAKHPQITFKSTKVEKVSATEYRVTGQLTMHGVTKVITLPVAITGEVTDPWGKLRTGFSAATTLDRKEFGITWNKALDSGGFMLGDGVEIEVNIEAIAQ